MPSTSYRERWADIVRGLDLDLTLPINFVTAKQIKGITGLEPRNMAYIDSRDALPEIFVRYGIFPLPVSNGRYALVKGQGFHDLEGCGPPQMYEARMSFPLVTLKAGMGETQQLDFAYNVGLLSHFSGVDDLRPTIRGRMYTPEFRFRVDGSPEIVAKSVQIEVDGGYEARSYILLFEGKIGDPGTFIIRQLYYPYRTWSELARTKSIRIFFMTTLLEERINSLWEYEFREPLDYESIVLRKARSFRVEERPLDPSPFTEISPSNERSRIVPQADDMTKILEFPFLVSEGLNKAQAVADYFHFDRRQSSYYREATEALGLVTLRAGTYELTDRGREYVRLPPDKRNQYFLRLALELPIMHGVLLRIIQAGRDGIGVGDIATVIKEKSHLSGTTPRRRAQTVIAWFRWIEKALGLVRVHGNRVYIRGSEWF